ncbi:MAG: glutamate-1-semialdehyde 2,1-aminomutase [Candidatus Omnitrophica bacterium]|nr:glutamate-1-semialdehyde 2,1-aminomutase [Candidatus Omnitrophota bacterium]
MNLSYQLFKKAKKVIPGGVNSPVRSHKSVGGYPLFVKKGKKANIFDQQNKSYIDYCLSWGALILGHSYPKVITKIKKVLDRGTGFGISTELEVELAKLTTEAFESIDKLRLVNSGTEATMSAIRLARAYTKKNKIIKFAGSYHGHADHLLAEAGSGLMALSNPSSLGVPKDFTKHTLVAPYNDIKKIEEIVVKHQKDLAAIILEPVSANCGLILPKENFLKTLRKIADKYNLILIFDEVITGFRFLWGGAEKIFGVKPDLVCLGKIIGGGLPVGAFGGKKRIMDKLAPLGDVYQAGTLSGNPVSVAAGLATLEELRRVNPYKKLNKKGDRLKEEIESLAKKNKVKLKINKIGSMFSFFFGDNLPKNYSEARKQDTYLFSKFYQGCLSEGIYFSPSLFEANFLSIAHKNLDLDKTFAVVNNQLKKMKRIVKS